MNDRQLADQGLLALEGAFLVEKALKAGYSIDRLYCVGARESWARGLSMGACSPTVLPEAAVSEIAGYPFHRGVYALARRRPAIEASEAARLSQAGNESGGRATVLVLPEISDPENVGAAFRNAAALGCGALFLGSCGPDPLSRRVLRVSMGASLNLPWARLCGPEDMAILSSLGFASAACILDPRALDMRAWPKPERLALVLGNEAFGLSAPWLEACEHRITLPMLGGTDSLNVSTAAAIFLCLGLSPSIYIL